jgi:hypothetical protein
MTKRASRPARTNVPAFPPMPTFDATFLDNFMRTGETCVRACVAWQGEFSRFVASRLESDGEVGKALASSTTLTEAAELQRDWLQSTAQDYFDEMTRLSQLGAKMAPAWMIPFAANVRKERSE